MKKDKKKKKSEKIKKTFIAAGFPQEAAKTPFENHKEAAFHNQEAAKYHLEAARHYEAGDHNKAAYNALLAHGHHVIAGQFITDAAKHHAQSLKQINYQASTLET